MFWLSIGSHGDLAGQFKGPMGLAIRDMSRCGSSSSSGDCGGGGGGGKGIGPYQLLAVADCGNDRVQVFICGWVGGCGWVLVGG
jgi:hypothetical protein